MNKSETIRHVKAIKISGTDCPKLPEIISQAGQNKRGCDPSSESRVENYPIPSFFQFRTISVDRCRV